MKHNSTITQLNLPWNELGFGDCTALAEAIKHNSTITQLNLERNGLGTRDCTALAEVIKHNLTVRQLDLARNEPCTGDRTALAEAIKHNSTITQLNLAIRDLVDTMIGAFRSTRQRNVTHDQIHIVHESPILKNHILIRTFRYVRQDHQYKLSNNSVL